ncbi:hypothetical protein [Natronobacterium texcoconense]|uniref:hypothetical protein n=1 Tax=Natronobacterium texcoconense TaxID=1095778 RepID=UPI001113E8EA|nr:hypothetical protein [Natronobacterium texcoconense]
MSRSSGCEDGSLIREGRANGVSEPAGEGEGLWVGLKGVGPVDPSPTTQAPQRAVRVRRAASMRFERSENRGKANGERGEP